MPTEILVVEDHEPTRKSICDSLRQAGYEVRSAENGAHALQLLEDRTSDLVISDYRMEPVDGLELLQRLHRSSEIPVILYSSAADADVVFKAGREGAFIFLEYPFRIDDQLLPTIKECLAPEAHRDDGVRWGAERMIGTSVAMHRARTLIRRVARSSATVLITGETGTGKELAATAIHDESGRDPFVAISLTELSESLIESELFGHQKGAFTGAVSTRSGLFERADGGTLFLDEVGDAPASVQAKLLRALETGEIRLVGGSKPRSVDVRVVAATNRDLRERIEEGLFREDLYYRLSKVSVHLPPLRERPGDVEPISRDLIGRLAAEARLPLPELNDDLFAALQSRPWHGNVRELQGLLQSLLLWWDGESPLGRADILEAHVLSRNDLDAESQAECERMLDAYRRSNHNQEAARRELGLSRGEWRHRWSRFGLDVLGRRRK